MNKKNSNDYFVADNGCSKNCAHNCENCKRNQAGVCSHYGVRVSKSNNCENAAKRV